MNERMIVNNIIGKDVEGKSSEQFEVLVRYFLGGAEVLVSTANLCSKPRDTHYHILPLDGSENSGN
jgi:hypothetical protein